MKIKEEMAEILILLSLVLTIVGFIYGIMTRPNGNIGGEVFLVALPILILWWREWSRAKEIEELQKLQEEKQGQSK